MYREISHSIIDLDKAIVVVGDSLDGEIYVSLSDSSKGIFFTVWCDPGELCKRILRAQMTFLKESENG